MKNIIDDSSFIDVFAHKWMISEFGFNNRCGVYAIIYYWNIHGNGTCFVSKENIAANLGATKSSICEARSERAHV